MALKQKAKLEAQKESMMQEIKRRIDQNKAAAEFDPIMTSQISDGKTPGHVTSFEEATELAQGMPSYSDIAFWSSISIEADLNKPTNLNAKPSNQFINTD